MRVLGVFLFLMLGIWQISDGHLTAQFHAKTNLSYGYSVNFGLKFKFCRFICLEKCGSISKGSNDVVEEESIAPDGFYWRDFYGMIPPDAYALGGSSQIPQTYIGLVYDPRHNGTFVTTIFDGTPHVYNTFKGKTYKLTENIKLLCTMKSDTLVWMKLTREIADNLKDVKNVLGGYHVDINKKNKTYYLFHYIVKHPSSTTYVGSVSALNATLEYAEQDGTIRTTEDFVWLMYITRKSGKENMQTERLCSHSYEFFYRLEYYWKPKITFNKQEAFEAGYSVIYPKLYIGQSFNAPDIFDVGYATKRDTYLHNGYHITNHGFAFYIFSTTNPDKFEWVNTTSADFSNLDKNRLIPGGSLPNGTKTYVGREIPMKETFPGTIHATPDRAFFFSIYPEPQEFQVLMFKEEK